MTTSTKNRELSREAYDALQSAFNDFQVRAEKLGEAFDKMHNDFKKVNLSDQYPRKHE
jgi:hypothetical protein